MLRTAAIRTIDQLTRWRGGRDRLLVLTYHRVLPVDDPLEPDIPDQHTFRRLMTALRQDFNVLPLDAALRRQAANQLPAGAVAVTFDDGFADNATIAWPILESLGLPATFFVATGFLDGGWMFNSGVIEACRHAPDEHWATGVPELGELAPGPVAGRARLVSHCLGKLKYLAPEVRRQRAERLLDSVGRRMPADLMMTREQVARLHSAGAAVGGHTRTHPILARLADADAERDIRDGRCDLEAITGEPPTLFAYPNGQPGQDYGAREIAMVRAAGFSAALNTVWDYSDARTDRFQIPRVGSWGNSLLRFSGRLALARARGADARHLAPVRHSDA
jgi:peptidoglycan/xylan/chitin deacetylase (PgdA/CDA1 family)